MFYSTICKLMHTCFNLYKRQNSKLLVKFVEKFFVAQMIRQKVLWNWMGSDKNRGCNVLYGWFSILPILGIFAVQNSYQKFQILRLTSVVATRTIVSITFSLRNFVALFGVIKRGAGIVIAWRWWWGFGWTTILQVAIWTFN